MLLDRTKYKEAAHIGEELFQDAAYELERQCMTVESVVKRKILSLPEALEAYEVTKEEFENYLAKNISENFLTLYVTGENIDRKMYLHVMSKAFQQVMGPHHKTKVAKIDKEIRQLAGEI
jgi:hypothetical protein